MRELAGWLRQVAAGEEVPRLSFTEPTLSFSIGATDPNGRTTIRIGFALEGRPPSRRRDEPLDVPWVVDFELTKRAVVEARRDLQDTLGRFPSR